MTSINSLKFNFHAGAMICDEQRHWNDDRMKIYAADKILQIVEPAIMKEFHLAAAYGNTGTSSIGDEIRLTLRNEITHFYNIWKESEPSEHMDFTVRKLAEICFDVIKGIKHQHIDDELLAKYGFSTREFCQGYRLNGNNKTEINHREIVDKINRTIAPPAGVGGANAVFGNKGILAGYDDKRGFQIFSFSMRDWYMEEIPVGFLAEGSGSDAVNYTLPSFFDAQTCSLEGGTVNPIEGIMALIDSVNMAARKNLGVGGYFNILLFDGQDPEGNIVREINDHRSHLASESMIALRQGFIESTDAREIIEGLIFKEKECSWGEERLIECGSKKNLRAFHRFLRGYRQRIP